MYLKDVVSFAYGDLMWRDVMNRRELLLRDVDRSYLSREKKGADGSRSRSTATAEMTGKDNEIVQWIYGQTTRYMCRLQFIRIA